MRPSCGSIEHVARLQLGARHLGATPHHDRDHLVGDVKWRLEPGALCERETHVHGDHDVHAHLPGQVDGQVVHQAPVHQQPAVDLHRGEYAGRRHARAQHGGEIARAQHHRIAALKVGGKATEWGRQLVEILHVRHAHGGAAQHLGDFLALHEPEWQYDTVVGPDTQAASREEAAIVLLAAIDQVPARGPVT